MIEFHRPSIDEDELYELQAVLASGHLSKGTKVDQFESMLSDYLGVPYVIACSSCTAALYLAIIVLDIPRGAKIAVADYTFPASGNVISLSGRIPKLVDVDPLTYNLNASLLDNDVEAIMPVHIYGQCANMDDIMEFARTRKIKVIEDAACALGSKWNDKYAGTFGDVGCFSLHSTKIIGTGEGGLFVTGDEEIAVRARIAMNHGRVGNTFVMQGWNYRMSDVQAAIGISQLRKLNNIINTRRALAARWETHLDMIDGIDPPFVDDRAFHTYQSYAAVLEDDVDLRGVIQYMRRGRAELTTGTYAMSCQPSFNSSICKVSESLTRKILRLPIHTHLNNSMISEMAYWLEDAIGENRI